MSSGGTTATSHVDFHSRQESADSGLGLGCGSGDSGGLSCGSGSSYSLPHTPEDFLMAQDAPMNEGVEMKSVAGGGPGASGATAASMMHSDMGPATQELESMDSEDLVPTIQLNDDLSTDFLNDIIGSTKLDNMHTWL